ncbi:hypothetical protein [Streptantibioticus silvisoli]|uniref:Spore coat protein U domain-containing protein n=1 Tax=Streptantibioticus silvisoli TaxID=2705255 RepID=A0ABT6VY83_9ACTN|nr:hypothetical protein [Streptantibioticus silvisoli]MDI5963440.1 hypothetical protein [Streptantibioticus silvisoli]
MALSWSGRVLRRAGASALLVLPLTLLAPAAPASAAASLTVDSATVVNGVAKIKLTAVCPSDQGPVPAQVLVSVQQGPYDSGVSGSGGFFVSCTSDRSNTATVFIPGRTGSGLTSHDADFVSGAATVSAAFEGTALFDETAPTYGTAEATRLS